MIGDAIKFMSMEKYGAYLARLFPDGICFELRANCEHLLWSWPEGKALADDLLNDCQPYVRACSSPCRKTVQDHLISEDRTLSWCVTETDGSGESISLAIVHPTRHRISTHDLNAALSEAIGFMRDEILLQMECNALANELGERYEELNLIFSTDDRVDSYQEGQKALEQLVSRCSEHLSVDCTILTCRDLGLLLTSSACESVDDEQLQFIKFLETDLYDHVTIRKHGLAINTQDIEPRNQFLSGREENVVACPILQNSGNAIGMILVISKKGIRTFSNSDVNVLEIMARKAARIIDTHHDSLTGLLKRAGFEYAVETTLAANNSRDATHCVLHVDIDQLHVVNDLFGYHEGNNCIRRISRILRSVVRRGDTCARLGGDEFGVLLPNCDQNHGRKIAEKLTALISNLAVVSENRELSVTAGVGIASITAKSTGAVEILKDAETACNAAKEAGSGKILTMTSTDLALVRRREGTDWVGKIQHALRTDGFVLYCQPEEPTQASMNPAHFEVLMRMLGDDGSELSPATFIPVAERFHLMPHVDRWVVENALKMIGEHWQDIAADNPVFSINLSGQTFADDSFCAFVRKRISQSGVPPKNICFEITETAVISNIDEAIAFMKALKELGCRFALDDFGAGLSSFGYLRILPVDYLKIDGSLVKEMSSDIVALAMVNAICQIGNTMGLSLIAEFVGDKATRDILQNIGIDFMQGFFIGHPVPLKDTLEQLGSAESRLVR